MYYIFHKLLLLGVVILLFFYQTNIDFKFYNSKDEIINLNQKQLINSIFIVLDKYVCIDCVKNLSDFIDKICNYHNKKILILLLTEDNIIARKLAEKKIKQFLPKNAIILFTFDANKNLFYTYKIKYTPTIFYKLKNNSMVLNQILYSEIFNKVGSLKLTGKNHLKKIICSDYK